MTPLHRAVCDESVDGPSILTAVLKLLKAGANVNAKTSNGRTPLHFAVQSNPTLALLEVLIKAGADVNAKTADGWTPLHFATQSNLTPAVLEVLIKAGADPRAIDSKGRTPHNVASPKYRDIILKAMMDKTLQ